MALNQENHTPVVRREVPGSHPTPVGSLTPTGTTAVWDFALLHSPRAPRLSSGPAHDLNSMLTAILGFVQLGRMRGEDAAGIQEELDAIDVAARRAVHLIRELVVAEHRASARAGQLDCNEVIRDLLPAMQKFVDPCEITLDLRADVPRGELPREVLSRIVFNLVLNAREAMPSGGRIRIATDQTLPHDGPAGPHGPELILSVSDEGLGMDTATLSRIFEPTFTAKGPMRGNGLALATVREILHNVGGRVTVTTDPGRGTTFVVRFLAAQR